MHHTDCINCKSSFRLNQVLPLESLTIQFKNYAVPIKEIRLKSILLKAMVAFLNSKGGTIYIGVDDNSGKVYGVEIKRKQMDQFRLVIKQLLQKIQPQVDLAKKEEVTLQYIPVLQKQEQFYGKYIIKIIVLQGDPSKLYCYSQKIQARLNSQQKYQIILSSKRHNMGGISQIKGIELINQIYQKATHPHQTYQIYHKGCNPKPMIKQVNQKLSTKNVKQKQNQQFNYEVINTFQSKKQLFIKSPRSINDDQSTLQNRIQAYSKYQNTMDEINTSFQSLTNQMNLVSSQQQMNRSIQIIHLANQKKQKEGEDKTLYISNINPDMKDSLVKFLTFSMTNKIHKQIRIQKDFIKLTFQNESLKNKFQQICKSQTILKALNSFGKNQMIKFKRKQRKLEAQNYSSESKQSEQIKQKNLIIFKDVQIEFEKSILNYLKKCMTTTIKKKIYIKSQSIELEFDDKKSMRIFYKLCTEMPHIRQLNHYGKNGKVKIQISKQNLLHKNCFSTQSSQTSQNLQMKNQKKSFLVASNIEPRTANQLKNYLLNNMSYKIQKKVMISQYMHYLKIQFQSQYLMRKYWSYTKIQPHNQLLNQFSSLASFRIGIPSKNLLIVNFNQHMKRQLKQKITQILGKGTVKKAQTKIINGNINVWILSLVDVSTIYQNYQKLVEGLAKSEVNANFRNGNSCLTVYIDYVQL